MFKKSNGRTGFSFSRLLTSAVPNFALDNAKNDAILSSKRQDDLFAHQMGLNDPKVFDELSFLVAGIVGSKSYSRSVLGSLQKSGIVDKTDGSVHTDLISKHFSNQVPEISIHRQRQLVCLLFFWEEEVIRWRLLDEEELEIRKAMEQHQEFHGKHVENEALKVALATVLVKRSTPPSSRGAEGDFNKDKTGKSASVPGPNEPAQPNVQPPKYHETGRTVSVSGGRDYINRGEFSNTQ